MDRIVCKWIKYAERDIIAAKTLLREGLLAESTFHSQQAAEKALKALLIARGVHPPKTHDIDLLLVLLQRAGEDIGELEVLRKLTRYAVEARYPDFEEEPTREEAEITIKTAEKAVKEISKRIESYEIRCTNNRE